MRLAIDIDSTLHHYWDVLGDVAARRYGIELPYEEQHTWTIDVLEPEQLAAVVAETHTDAVILDGRPYPGAVETVAAWHADGHWIHITSHRAPAAHEATARWLDAIGLPYDDLHCSADKIARARDLQIDILIDDSPVNLHRAMQEGMRAATIAHPWNAEIRAHAPVLAAADWDGLAAVLAPVLADTSPA